MLVQRFQSISAFFLDDEAKQSQAKAYPSVEPDTGCPKKRLLEKKILTKNAAKFFHERDLGVLDPA